MRMSSTKSRHGGDIYGFSDEERDKFSTLLSSGFIDTFRYFNPDLEGVYSWWSYRFNARKNNAGWRIDYFIVSDCLTSDERVHNVMKQAEFFGYSGDRVKGLIFCSRIDEARELSTKFNEKGWRTLVLSGSDSEATRAVAIERLAGDEDENALDYIISVDIFSEGVDVPEINQVIMLRPTESPVIFIQQLGRGLRKAEDKEYVVVIDFIGNYRNNSNCTFRRSQL